MRGKDSSDAFLHCQSCWAGARKGNTKDAKTLCTPIIVSSVYTKPGTVLGARARDRVERP